MIIFVNIEPLLAIFETFLQNHYVGVAEIIDSVDNVGPISIVFVLFMLFMPFIVVEVLLAFELVEFVGKFSEFCMALKTF